MKENILRCCICGEEFAPDEVCRFENRIYCLDCLEEETVVCEDCGERVRMDEAVTDSNNTLCRFCFNENYCYCEDCGGIIHNDNAYYMDGDEYEEYPYCYTCYARMRKDKAIHDYGYKPDPIFYGDGKMVIGVELEVDCGGYDNDNAKEVLKIANKNREDRLYVKNDGSLDDGFELVSHPMTLSYHKNEMPWESIMKKLVHMGYKSHQACTCGLHCHVSRAALGDCYDKQEDATGRILYFVEHHWNEILKFSRRTEAQMERWAARYGNNGNPKKLYNDVKKGYCSRYRAVNILNYSTIEFRMFRGTLKYNTFIATLQFVNEICKAAVSLSDEEMEALTWENFVSSLDEKNDSELITYLKERKLYTKEAE
ncbi:MAG: zinc-binding protein [Clostridiales bacterium]|nr:zinc-binding protein [Clostridiales bacterium]